ncbi:T9SS type A sorting domain-containing protein [candidate division KSB1 bacterium]|nr:T9SS type A sorting domain-containing protein [candidate division KSB1 bacterium]
MNDRSPVIGLLIFAFFSVSAAFPWNSVPVLLSPLSQNSSSVHTFAFDQPDYVGIDLGESTVTKTVSGIVGDKSTSSLLAGIPIIAYWGGDFRYPLRDTVYTDQTGRYSADIVSRLNPLDVHSEFEFIETDLAFKLYNSFPNPATRGASTLVFDLYKPGFVRLSLYNISGQRLATRSDNLALIGSYSVKLDLGGLANGVYFYKLETEHGAEAGRLLVLHENGRTLGKAATLSQIVQGGNAVWQNYGQSLTKQSNGADLQSSPSFWDAAPDFFVLSVRVPGYKPLEQKVFHSGTATAFNFIIEPTDSQFVTLDVVAKNPSAGSDSLLENVNVIVCSKAGNEYGRTKTNVNGRAVFSLAELEVTDSLKVKLEYEFPGEGTITSETLVATNFAGITYLDANIVEDYTAHYVVQAFDRLDNPIQATYEFRHNSDVLEVVTSNSAVTFDVDLQQYSGDGFAVYVEAHGYLSQEFDLQPVSAGETKLIGLYLSVNNADMIYQLSGHVQESGSNAAIDTISVEAWHQGRLLQSTLTNSSGNYTLTVAGGGQTDLGIDDTLSIVFNSKFFVNQTVKKAAKDDSEILNATLDFDDYNVNVTGVLKSDGQILPAGQIMTFEVNGLTRKTAITDSKGVFDLSYPIGSQSELGQSIVLVGENLGANGFTYFNDVRETVNIRDRNTQEINPSLQFNTYSLRIKGSGIGSDGQGGLDGGTASLYVDNLETNSQNLSGEATFELSYTVTKLREALNGGELRISHPYFTTNTTIVSLSSSATQDYGAITAQFQQSEFRVQGEVKSSKDGNPLEGAVVNLPGAQDALTDTHGWFTTNSLYLNSRADIGIPKILTISHIGHTNYTRTMVTAYNSIPNIGVVSLVYSFTPYLLTIDGDTEFNLTEPGVGPVSAATVKLVRDEDELVLAETSTTANGNFMNNLTYFFQEPQDGTAHLEWSKSGFQTGIYGSINISEQATHVIRDQTIYFDPLDQPVSGRITSVTTSNGIANATISWQSGLNTTTDTNGNYSYIDVMTLSNDAGKTRTATVSAFGYRDSTFTYTRSTSSVTRNLALEDGPVHPQLDINLWVRDLLGNTSNIAVTLQADGFPAEILATSNGLLSTKLDYNGNATSNIRVWIGDGMVAIPEIGKTSARTGTGVIDTLKVTAADLAVSLTAYYIPNTFTNPNGGSVSFNEFCDFIGAATGFARNFVNDGEIQVMQVSPSNKPTDAGDYNDTKSTIDALLADLTTTMNDGQYFGMENVSSRLLENQDDGQFEASNTLQLYTDGNAASNSFNVGNRTSTHVTRGAGYFVTGATAEEKREQMLGLLLDLVDYDGNGIVHWMVGSDGHIHALGHQVKNAIYIFRGKQIQ